MADVAVKQVFLVGCPRSGTTLLQSLLAAHREIISLPETHYFTQAMPRPVCLSRLGLASPAAVASLRAMLLELNAPEAAALLPGATRSLRRVALGFAQALNRFALVRDRRCWLEKTPGHLSKVRLIRRYLPRAHFLHLLRRGEDVVASLYDVSHEHPEYWRGRWTLEQCMGRWSRDVRMSRKYIGHPHHLHVRYERLVESPEAELGRICEFLDLEYDAAMVQRHGAAATALVRGHEPWKAGVGGEVAVRQARKFDTLFDEAQRRFVQRRIASLDELGF